jgi:hypothetical protein
VSTILRILSCIYPSRHTATWCYRSICSSKEIEAVKAMLVEPLFLNFGDEDLLSRENNLFNEYTGIYCTIIFLRDETKGQL